MQRLLRGDTDFDRKSKNAWARFLMSMFHRSPEGIDRTIAKIKDEFPKNIEDFRLQYDALPTREALPTFEEFTRSLTESDFQEFHLHALRRMMDSKLLGARLNEMIWTVVPNISRQPLFTSDRPIFVTALGRDNAHLAMPLTPWQIFLAAADEKTMENLDNRNRYGGFARILDNRVVRQARRHVYSVDDARIDFIRYRLGDRQSWLSDIG